MASSTCRSTSARWPSARRGRCANCSTSSSSSTRIPSTARGPLWQFFVIEGLEGGRSALFWKIHHAVTDGIGMGYLAEHHLQRTAGAELPPVVDLDAVLAEAVEASRVSSERPPIPTAIANTAGHFLRRQAGISRRLMGEMAMLGADPNRVVDLVNGVAKTVAQARRQMFVGGRGDGEAASGSPLWQERFAPPSARSVRHPTRGGLRGGQEARRQYQRLLRDRSRQRRRRLPRARRHPHQHRQPQFRGEHPYRQSHRRQLLHTHATPGARRKDGARATAERGARSHGGQARRGNGSGDALGARGCGQPAPHVGGDVDGALAGAGGRTSPPATCAGRGNERFVSGARVEAQYPFGPVAGTAFNLTTVSYNGSLGHGLFVDPVAVAEPARLRDDMIDAYHELIDAAGTTKRRSRASVGR